jgi:phenylacetate-CoA ligase
MARLEGGIRGRVDDMVTIRGVNVYPTAIEAVVRRFGEVVEFRSTVAQTGSLRTLSVEIEVAPGTDAEPVAKRLADELREGIGLAAGVTVAAPGALPRFEMKAHRFVVT